ncbi:Sensor histidine kinase YpdA [Bacillus sp. THAF10]|uniref:sensor histidine kinase n=1 Tax=Bacillus sp. THAF10 TaxID=2587848 RepID=UPI001267B74D|nr:histidine kinase [Bacillus sp. THAF10]QFT87929.1 Sensor histidine kinase YpdA [Bacillus sp. THAF10]
MTNIQKKILTLTTVVLVIMSAIWLALTYYNYKTHKQYNEILQRYLSMNEVTKASQQVITDLNNYMIEPTPTSLAELEESKEKVLQAKYNVYHLRNTENDFTLTNYLNLVDSLIETTDRLILFQENQDTDLSTQEFSEANRISTYISETTLTLIDMELNTYNRFYRGIIEQSAEVIKLGIWVLLLITGLLLVGSYWFSLSITRPIFQLTRAANALSKGDFDAQVKVETNDEIAFLAKTFDRMRININNLISEIKSKAALERELQESRLLLQESQFRSLQSQINPHFLFNTLNTLSKKAYLEGSEETSDLLVSVAGILRYNLKRQNRSVTLQDEIIVLQQYMDIQKARFTDRLTLVSEIDESCLDLKIPALTLQPIIENAVIHAVEPKEEGGTIWFRVKKKENFIIIEIEDDGLGMPEEKIVQILKEEALPTTEGHSTGIGFSNVVKRLRLFYGYEEVFEIESKQDKGTKIILSIKEQPRFNKVESA